MKNIDKQIEKIVEENFFKTLPITRMYLGDQHFEVTTQFLNKIISDIVKELSALVQKEKKDGKK